MRLTAPPTIPREPSESDIRHAAYLLWLDSGRPAGHARELWFATPTDSRSWKNRL